MVMSYPIFLYSVTSRRNSGNAFSIFLIRKNCGVVLNMFANANPSTLDVITSQGAWCRADMAIAIIMATTKARFPIFILFKFHHTAARTPKSGMHNYMRCGMCPIPVWR